MRHHLPTTTPLFLILLVLSSVLCLPSSASFAGAGSPILRLETGMHTAMVTRISVDTAGRYLVSASNDKTLRLWSLPDLTLLKTLRVPISAGNEGKLYATAISPDGQWIAAGGWTRAGYIGAGNHNIYLFNRSTGQMQHRITGLGNVIFHLAFSPDGRYLAASLGGGQGMRVWRSSDWLQLAKDTDYGDHSYWCDFSYDGRLLTTAWDGYVRLYDSDFRLQRKRKAAGGSHPFAAVFSPDGGSIAVGFRDSTAVNVLDGDTLALRYAPDSSGVNNGNLGSVAWADGALYAGGRWNIKGDTSGSGVRRWSNAGRGSYRDLPVSANTIMDIRPLPAGGVAVGSADPAITLLDVHGNIAQQRLPAIADFRANHQGFLISDDGLQVKFAFEQRGKSAAIFDITQRQITVSPASSTGLQSPDSSSLNIRDWKNTTHPTLNGQALKLKPYEISRSLAIAPDQGSFLLGADWSLRRFDRNGRELWRQSVPATAWGVNISGNGKFAIAAFGDGMIRWYRYSNGKLLLSFFPHKDKKRWILWTPEGFFDHSKGAESLIGFHINQGKDQAARFIGIAQMYDLFYRPDLIAAKLNGDDQAIESALAKIGSIDDLLASGLPPHFTVAGRVEEKINNNRYNLVIVMDDPKQPHGRIVTRLNGVVLSDVVGKGGKRSHGKTYRHIDLPVGRNLIEVSVFNTNNTIESKSIRKTVIVTAKEQRKPRLYVLAVGVEQYKDATFKLKYPVHDATDFANTLKQQGKPLFAEIHIKKLSDEQVTVKNIRRAFARWAKEIRVDDVFVLFLSGHGLALNGRYHFIPQDLIYENDAVLQQSSLSQSTLESLLKSIKAQKALVALDTCDSGAFLAGKGMAHKAAIGRLIHNTGRAFLSASSSNEMAFDGYKGHGVFTYALLQGLRGGADSNHDGMVSIDELAAYVGEQVPRLSYQKWKRRQYPQRELHGQSFPIAVVGKAP